MSETCMNGIGTDPITGGYASFSEAGVQVSGGPSDRPAWEAGLRQSLVIMAGWCGDTPRLAFSHPGW
jgi:hypothetical protein